MEKQMEVREVYYQVCYESDTVPEAVGVIPKIHRSKKEAEAALKNVREFHDKPGVKFFVRKVTTVTTYQKV